MTELAGARRRLTCLRPIKPNENKGYEELTQLSDENQIVLTDCREAASAGSLALPARPLARFSFAIHSGRRTHGSPSFPSI